MVVEALGGVDLLEYPPLDDRHAVPHGHGLHLVMGDVERGHAEVALQAGDLGAHLHAQLGIQVRQWLVHQEGLGVAHDRPPHRHPLALPARQQRWPLVQVLGQFEDPGGLCHPLVDLCSRNLGHLQGEPDVLLHRLVRIQRIVLEHHRDVAVLGLEMVDDFVVDLQRAAGDVFESGDHSQHRRLPTTRRPHHHDELAIGDVQRHIGHGLIPVRVHLGDVFEHYLSHVGHLLVG